uniref:Ankyrin repeat domain 24 n=3 Tax=Rodentia TaxID=9989 RepID=I3MVI2_ICTTR
MKTLRARFKK